MITPETQAEAKTPAIPDELWMLAEPDGNLLWSADGWRSRLAFLTEAEAKDAAAGLGEEEGCELRPIRVK